MRKTAENGRSRGELEADICSVEAAHRSAARISKGNEAVVSEYLKARMPENHEPSPRAHARGHHQILQL